MFTPRQFSTTHGENIVLTEQNYQANWRSLRSGGWVYDACKLTRGEKVTIVFDGSGHCDVGYLHQDPANITSPPEDIFQKMNEARFHKRTCEISASLSENKKQVEFRYESSLKRKIDKGKPVWIVVYVKFGDVTLHLKGSSNENRQFSSNHGTNIRLEDDRRVARSITLNPAAICFVDKKINVNEKVKLECSPLREGDHTPGRFHLKLSVYNRDPGHLKTDFKSAFDANVPQTNSDPPLTCLEILDKTHCEGIIEIFLVDNTTIQYYAASGKHITQALNFDACRSSGFWLVLELYRVLVRASSTPLSINQLDSRILEPCNERAENSLDMISVCKTDSSYFSFTTPKEVMRQDGAPVAGARPLVTTPAVSRDHNMNIDFDNEARSLDERFEQIEAKQNQMQDQLKVLVQQTSLSPTTPTSTSYIGLSLDTERSPLPCNKEFENNVQENWTHLVHNMRADRLCDHFYQRKLITSADMTHILELYKTKPEDANRQLLLVLRKKNIVKAMMDEILEQAEEEHLKTIFFPGR